MPKVRALLLALCLAATLLLPNLARAAGGTVTVQPGDTLTSIAARSGTSVDALVQANGLASANVIYAGQVLTIPGGGAAAPVGQSSGSGQGGASYTVQPGDYLSVIAQNHGVSQDALLAANGISNP